MDIKNKIREIVLAVDAKVRCEGIIGLHDNTIRELSVEQAVDELANLITPQPEHKEFKYDEPKYAGWYCPICPKGFFVFYNASQKDVDRHMREFHPQPEHKSMGELKVSHVNPNCKDSRFCLPHSEMDKNVGYDTEKMLSHIRKLESDPHLNSRNLLERFITWFNQRDIKGVEVLIDFSLIDEFIESEGK